MFYEIAEKALALQAKGRKIIRLNVGDTNLPVPKFAVDAAKKSMDLRKSAYGSSAGMPQLREAVAARENCDVSNVVVGPGSKHLIFALLSVLGKKGSRVALPSPHWPAYQLACGQLGLAAFSVETSLSDGWQFGGVPREAGIAIICNPLNPTSTVYSEESIERAIADAAATERYIILDEAYRGLAFKPIPKYSGAIRVRSFSKEFNMEDWRLAYAVAPEEIVEKIVMFNQMTSTCVPSFVQQAGIACLENEKEILGENVRKWIARMGCASSAMRKAGFGFAKPEAGMYIFATHGGITDSAKFALKLLDLGVAVAPGASFGNHGKFVRICANQPEETLESAIAIMGEAASR